MMFSLCCLSNRELLCGILSKGLYLNGWILAGCKFIVMKFCLNYIILFFKKMRGNVINTL